MPCAVESLGIPSEGAQRSQRQRGDHLSGVEGFGTGPRAWRAFLFAFKTQIGF